VEQQEQAHPPTASPDTVSAGAPERGGAGRLVLAGLAKRYPGFTAVERIDLDVPSGEFLTLLGPSGSGKTTTLMMVAGFTTPSAGDIRLNGRSIAGLAPERRNIGVVFQNYALFPHMTVADNIAFPLKMRRLTRAASQQKVHMALRLVQLDGMGERLPRQLSGGQQQRVAIARAVVFGPDLLLMDEPLGALDRNLRGQMQFELKRLHAELGVTILYVTHDQEEALTMSDRVALMNRGRIEQVGTAQQLYERPANRFVAGFIGESNVIEGRVDLSGDARCFVVAEGGRFAVPPEPCALADGPAVLVVRPEKLALVSPASDAAMAGRVREQVYIGDVTRYRVALQDGPTVTIKVQNGSGAVRVRDGETVGVFLDPRDVRILAA